MRATEGNRRVRTWRKLGGIAAVLALALTGLGSGAATATNSRALYVGTNLVDANGAMIDNVINATRLPGHDGFPDNAGPNPLVGGNLGVLIPTPVSAGFATAVPIQVLNGDNQTIAHVNLTFPSPANPPGYPTLASGGLSFVAPVEGTDASACSPVGSPVTSVTCNFDNLAAGAVKSFYIVLNTTVATTVANLVSVQVTTNNENGSNLQLFTSTSGAFKVAAASTDGLNAFVPPGQLRKLFSTNGVGGSNKLQTSLDFAESAGGNLVAIAETDGGSTSFLYTCPSGLSCQPIETTVSVQDGLTGSATQFTGPYLTITLTALVPKTYSLSKAFVAHYGASTTTPDWILYWGTKSTRCGTNVAATLANLDQCFNNATLSKPNADGFETLVLQVTTKHNGGLRM